MVRPLYTQAPSFCKNRANKGTHASRSRDLSRPRFSCVLCTHTCYDHPVAARLAIGAQPSLAWYSALKKLKQTNKPPSNDNNGQQRPTPKLLQLGSPMAGIRFFVDQVPTNANIKIAYKARPSSTCAFNPRSVDAPLVSYCHSALPRPTLL